MPSVPPSTRCWVRPRAAGWVERFGARRISASCVAAEMPANSDTCCSRRCTPSRRVSGGSAAGVSTTSVSASRYRRPRRTASRPSTRCSAWRSDPGTSCTSATTSPAEASAASPSVRSWRRTQGRREATRAVGHGSGRPVWGCASRRRPSSRSERADPRWRSVARREPPWTRWWLPTPRSCVRGVSARPRRRTKGAAKVSGSSDAPDSSIPRRSTTTGRTGATRRSGRPTRWERRR